MTSSDPEKRPQADAIRHPPPEGIESSGKATLTQPGTDRKVTKTEAEWRAQLDPMQFEVARHAATERPFTGKYWDHWDEGQYNCVGCGTPLFKADTKFDAGCGWPSYSEPINSEVVERSTDRTHGMVRVEVRCKHCGSHLGHVFDDGPTPTGERFCINSAAIDFAPK